MIRLGLDIGTNSIGWCLIEYDEARPEGTRVVDIGVRIFSDGRDPKSGASLAVDRRAARAMRRRRDRYIGRRSAFLEALIQYGLMPADADEARLVAEQDPYPLRARALEARLEPYEIGRALFHLNQRRGFLSNRKAERRAKDNEDGKIATGERSLDEAMNAAGADTLGAFLAGRLADGKAARVRLNGESQEYDFYPQRRHLVWEFQRIWEEQARHHPALLTQSGLSWKKLAEEADRHKTDKHNKTWQPKEARDALYRILFFQRQLKTPEVGLCLFAGRYGIPRDAPRLAKAHPLFQERRLYEEVNQLEITSPGEAPRKLTLDQRDHLIRLLREKRKVAYSSLAKSLKLQPGENFNKASETRADMLGNEVYAALADKKRFGNLWAHKSPEQQWSIIERLLDEENPDALRGFLVTDCGLDEERAATVAKTPLPEGHGRLGEIATGRILEQLKTGSSNGAPLTYSQAVEACGWHHSDDRTGEVLDRLPYYGELLARDIPPGSYDPKDLEGSRHEKNEERYYGKITNPTVHIGLRQLEKLINAIIAVHGRPDQIVVELARELKLNEKDKDEHNRRIRKDTADAIRRGEHLEREGIANTGANRALYKLWEELNPGNVLDRRCPYCAEPIGMRALFSGEGQADIDHIIPYSRSLDDSTGNKVVAHRRCNRAKGNMTPHERWSHEVIWEKITEQVARLHRSKQWRFGPDAMARFEGERDFLARQLTDTQYLSRLAGKYLRSLYPDKDSGSVYVIPGRMTAMLRRLWGLNSLLPDHNYVENAQSNAPKNRLDHRHHAIDAAVVAVTTRGLLQEVAHAAGRAENKDLDRLFEDLRQPWDNFREALGDALGGVTASHKADHGRKSAPSRHHDITAGALHNETAYGLTGLMSADGKTPIVVHRVPVSSLKPADFTHPDRIPDRALREALYAATRDRTGKEFADALARFCKADGPFRGLRHVRVREPLNVIPIHDKAGRAYKAYKGDGNARWELWRLPDGSLKTEVMTIFAAHQPRSDYRPHPAAKRLLSLRQNDLVAAERNGAPRQILRVVAFNVAGRLMLAPANEAGNLKERDGITDDPFKYIYLQGRSVVNAKVRQVRIDPLGRLFDPGPRA